MSDPLSQTARSEVGIALPDAALIDEFCDALWLEDGLAKNSLEAYRRDITLLARWLAASSNTLVRAGHADLAAYLDAWKQKIERIGTLNYPEEARGMLYGAVVLFVELRAEDGSLYNAEISKSSGHKVLDQAALRILRMSAPFGPIPPQGLGGATVLSFARTWYFTQGDALNTAVSK